MLIDFDRFCLNFPVKMPCAVVLSVLSGVGGCGWPILINVCQIGTALFALIDKPASSASAAEAITFLMIVAKM